MDIKKDYEKILTELFEETVGGIRNLYLFIIGSERQVESEDNYSVQVAAVNRDSDPYLRFYFTNRDSSWDLELDTVTYRRRFENKTRELDEFTKEAAIVIDEYVKEVIRSRDN